MLEKMNISKSKDWTLRGVMSDFRNDYSEIKNYIVDDPYFIETFIILSYNENNYSMIIRDTEYIFTD